MADPTIKIYGLQRTGTNLARWLLRANFGIDTPDERDTGWKHGPMPVAPWTADAKFILCVRHPLAQFLSHFKFCERSYLTDATMPGRFKPGMSFEEFLFTPLYEFSDLPDRWDRMHRSWMNALPHERTLIIRQEDQLRHQAWIIDNITRKLGLTPTAPDRQVTTARIDVQAKENGTMDYAFCEDRKYLDDYTPAMRDILRKRLDPFLLQRFGYDIQI